METKAAEALRLKNTDEMELHEYQKRMANHIQKTRQCVLSVDMGLGKTAATLAWLDWAVRQRKVKTALIIAPKRVAELGWKQEAERWGYSIAAQMVIVKGTAVQRRKALEAPQLIKVISRDNIKDVKGWGVDALIIDELTTFKNVDSARTKTALTISAAYKVGLTGTFLANGAIDIYGQCAAVGLADRWQMKNFYAWRGGWFRDVLAGSGLSFSKWRLKMEYSLPMLLTPVRDNIFTLTAADYLTIPDVSHITHPVEVSGEVRTAIEELNAFLTMSLGSEVLTFSEKQKFAKLQTLTNGFVYIGEDGLAKRGERSRKLETVADFVEQCKEKGEPVLLFYAYREEKYWLEELLTERGVKCDDVKNEGFLQRWEQGETECLLAHPASAGHGLNLQHGGRIIVWSTLTYNYEYYAQANARLARQGQTKKVQIHTFIAANTVEERIVQALQRKDESQKEFLTITKQ